jgi:ferredoxin-type protein NapH
LAKNNQSHEDKRERKERTLRAIKSRRTKQYFAGASFMLFLVGGWFYPLIGFFIPACMIAGVSLATRKGRKWCDWMCPRGSFADAYMKLISPQKTIPHSLRSYPVRIGILSFLILMLGYQVVRLWPDPYAIGRFLMVLLSVTTVIGVFLTLSIHQRTWCYICPIGSLANLVGKNKEKLHMKEGACVVCKLCAKTCPMDLKPQELNVKKEMTFRGDCLKCGLCVQICKKDALGFQKAA